MSARQRVRFEVLLEDANRLATEGGRARRELERLRRQPAVRAGRALARATRSVVRRIRSLTARDGNAPAPRQAGPAAEGDPARSATVRGGTAHADEADWPSSPAEFRRRFIDALSGGATWRDRPFHVAVVVDATGLPIAERDRSIAHGLGNGFEALGFRVSHLELGDGTEPAWDPSIDVAVITSAGIARRRLPRNVVTIAVVYDQVDRWLDDPGFDDHDLLAVGDDALRPDLEARSPHPVLTIAETLTTPAAAEALRDALLRWARAPKVAVHIGPLTWEAAAAWGDTPFGRAVQQELERRGWPATVHVFAERDSGPARRADVALHIFGARAPEVHPGQVSMLWVISHPDRVSTTMCEPYDVVFAASDLFASQLAERVRPPVLPLHQATDPNRFFPDPTGPNHELLFVGSSRKIRRRILADLDGTTRDLAVYGGGWTADLLDPRYVRGEWIPNWDLRRYYSSAGIVLCDHYDDMRDEGFISNRAYDALACGALVVSDRVPGMDAEFDGGVVTYEDADDLASIVDHYLGDPAERRARADRGRAAVLARHTFGQRVEVIIAEAAKRLGPLA
jgi:glycosyltransferase involved in cell wall biosynthesis